MVSLLQMHCSQWGCQDAIQECVPVVWTTTTMKSHMFPLCYESNVTVALAHFTMFLLLSVSLLFLLGECLSGSVDF